MTLYGALFLRTEKIDHDRDDQSKNGLCNPTQLQQSSKCCNQCSTVIKKEVNYIYVQAHQSIATIIHGHHSTCTTPCQTLRPPTSIPSLLPSTNTKTKAITCPQPPHSIDEVHQLLLNLMENMENFKSSLCKMTLITTNLPSLLEKPNQNCSCISLIVLSHTGTRTITAPTPNTTRTANNPHSNLICDITLAPRLWHELTHIYTTAALDSTPLPPH